MTATETPVDNGVNVEALLGVRDALARHPGDRAVPMAFQVSWVNGTHSRSDVETFYRFGESNSTTRRSATTSTTRCSSPPRTTVSRRWSMSWWPSAAA